LDFGGSFEEQLHGSAQQLNSNRRWNLFVIRIDQRFE
jgi:hypothetical protein